MDVGQASSGIGIGERAARSGGVEASSDLDGAVGRACAATRSLPSLRPPSMRRRHTQSVTAMTTIKVSAETRDRLKKIADAEQATMEAALAKVLDEAEEARFWQGVKDDYARLQDDPEQWASYVDELAEWDRTISDGLDALE